MVWWLLREHRNLASAKNLTREQITSAITDATTILPAGLAVEPA